MGGHLLRKGKLNHENHVKKRQYGVIVYFLSSFSSSLYFSNQLVFQIARLYLIPIRPLRQKTATYLQESHVMLSRISRSIKGC